MTTFFDIRHDNGTAHVNIFGEFGVGQSAEDFIAELRDAQTVKLRMDCPGGDSSAGIKIHDALSQRNMEVTITGRCGSAALVAIMGAKRIVCIDTARPLVHQPVKFVLGNASQLRFEADWLEKTRTRFEEIIFARTKQPLEIVRGWVGGETYFSAAEALAVGLVDEIYSAPAAPLVPVIVASGAPIEKPATEMEEMFMAWLLAFGPFPVANRAKFFNNVGAWLNQNVAE